MEGAWGESVEEKEAGRVREAEEEGAGSGISKWQVAGKIGKITQHSEYFAIEKAQRGGRQQN